MSTAMQSLIKESNNGEPKTVKKTVVEPTIIEPEVKLKIETKVEELISDDNLDVETLKQRTAESMQDEIKKLREENAKKRIETKTAHDLASKMIEEKTKEFEAKSKELDEKAKKYDEIERLKTDSSKSAEEKLNAKELEVRQLSETVDAERKSKSEAERKLNEFLDEQRNEKEIKTKVLQSRIDDIIKTIPEDKKKFATALVNGFEDKQEGLMSLLEAKQSNLFGTKKVEVAHVTPKGNTSSTINSDNLNYKQKMKRGLADIRGNQKPGSKLV